MKPKFHMAEIVLLCTVWLGLTLFCWFSPTADISISERRPLAEAPAVTAETILNGSFMTDFETYTLDQFPLRDGFRRIKALSAYHLFRQKDNNDIYLANGHAVKLEYALNQASLENAAEKLHTLYETYLAETDANIYFSMVPDKGCYLASPNGYPVLDTDAMAAYFEETLPFATQIDIFDTLTPADYYYTDSHWRQENISATAEKLADAMGITLQATYNTETASVPFYGVYYGQAALPMKPDEIRYLTNDILSACTVYNVENGKTTGVYDMEKLQGNDPYEMFLSGAAAILHLENPNANTGKELIMFRDSYGSAIAPLLAEAYDKITLVDTRYVAPAFLSQYVDFAAADDVLFLYSTSLLNNSGTLK